MYTFPRCEHLKKAADFTAVFKNGRKRAVAGALLYYLPNTLPHHRVGFAMRRGYGNAVERNRCKRLSREAWRLLPKGGAVHYDMVLLMRSKGGTLADRQKQLAVLTRGLVSRTRHCEAEGRSNLVLPGTSTGYRDCFTSGAGGWKSQ